jgi:3-isopropylmalate/(R)-2-methylmalate dehydratase small subunit
MSADKIIAGVAAALPIPNLDTDQIMPKQFLRGIDKAGLDRGVFYDLRFDANGGPRSDFVLNRPEYAGCRILVAEQNFGCGSSREHAVWGLVQWGIRAVIAPSFGEIFYSNAMNNGLLLIVAAQADVDRFMNDVCNPATNEIQIDVERLQVRSRAHAATFAMSGRHRRMFLDGLDLVGASLASAEAIANFERKHWEHQPWLQSVGALVRARTR